MTDEKLYDQIAELKDTCIKLHYRNEMLTRENKILYDFIKGLGVKLEKSVEKYKDWKEGWTSFVKITVPMSQFVVPFVNKSEVEWWRDQLDHGYLINISKLDHKPLIRADFTQKNTYDVKYFNEEVKRGVEPSVLTKELGVPYFEDILGDDNIMRKKI